MYIESSLSLYLHFHKYTLLSAVECYLIWKGSRSVLFDWRPRMKYASELSCVLSCRVSFSVSLLCVCGQPFRALKERVWLPMLYFPCVCCGGWDNEDSLRLPCVPNCRCLEKRTRALLKSLASRWPKCATVLGSSSVRPRRAHFDKWEEALSQRCQTGRQAQGTFLFLDSVGGTRGASERRSHACV